MVMEQSGKSGKSGKRGRVVKAKPHNESDDGDAEGQAKLKLVEFLTDTPDKRLSETTEIPGRLAMVLPLMETFEHIGEISRTMSLSEIWRLSVYRHNRSLKRKHLSELVILAQEQAIEEEEEPKDKLKW